MPDARRIDLAKYRLEKAENCYLAALQLFESGLFHDSASRSYYAIFDAIRALLAIEQVDFKKHSGLIGYFQQHYIKEKIFDVKYSDYIRDAFSTRQRCDYDDFYIVADKDVETQLHHAREFIDEVTRYIQAL